MSLLALEFNPIIAGKQIRDIFFIDKFHYHFFLFFNFTVSSQSIIEKKKSNQSYESIDMGVVSYFSNVWKWLIEMN